MIMNSAYYDHQLRVQSSERDAAQETPTKGSSAAVKEPATQWSSDTLQEVVTQSSPDASVG